MCRYLYAHRYYFVWFSKMIKMIRSYQPYCDNSIIRIFDDPVDEYKLLCTRHIIGDWTLQKSQQQQIAIADYMYSSHYTRT